MKLVLLIDGDATHITTAKSMLENDYEVITARSGKEALTLFYRGLVPNLILLDLKMTGMDEWDTCERIKSTSSLHTIPVAIFISSDDPHDKQKAQQMGAVDYIQKPVKKGELLERVGRLIHQSG